MKEILQQTESNVTRESVTVASFFFNARAAEPLEKTLPGLFRSLLHQVLQKDDKAFRRLVPKYLKKKQTQPGSVQWHKTELRQFLFEIYATSESTPAFIFIDALDECENVDVLELEDFFRTLAVRAFKAKARLRICFSSRHYPDIRIDSYPEVIVEHHNNEDIIRYVRHEAKYDKAISELQKEIVQKASGIFIWAVLVIGVLRKQGPGKSSKRKKELLDKIPSELNQLFRKLFKDIQPHESLSAVLLFQWILFSQEQLSLAALTCALSFGSETPPTSLADWKRSANYLSEGESRKKLILSLSRGLLEFFDACEFDKDDDCKEYDEDDNCKEYDEDGDDDKVDPFRYYSAQIIHESVRDFFIHGEGLTLLSSSLARSQNIVARGHTAIVKTYVNSLQVEEFLPKPWPPSRQYTTTEHPLQRYALTHVLSHIDIAEENGETQTEPLRILFHCYESNC